MTVPTAGKSMGAPPQLLPQRSKKLNRKPVGLNDRPVLTTYKA